MRTILNGVKKWQRLIKLVLFLSIASLVIVEIIRLFKTISFDKIGAIFGELSPIKVISLALLGFMAVAPMVFYDKILNKELNQKQKLSYLLETSWTINSLNNMMASPVWWMLVYDILSMEMRNDLKKVCREFLVLYLIL